MGQSILTIFIKLKLNKMGFYKDDNRYSITRYTGNQANILGVIFDDENTSDNNIEVIEWEFPKIDKKAKF